LGGGGTAVVVVALLARDLLGRDRVFGSEAVGVRALQ
jgi:hypothetical protein